MSFKLFVDVNCFLKDFFYSEKCKIKKFSSKALKYIFVLITRRIREIYFKKAALLFIYDIKIIVMLHAGSFTNQRIFKFQIEFSRRFDRTSLNKFYRREKSTKPLKFSFGL